MSADRRHGIPATHATSHGGHETRDVALRPVVWSALGLAALVPLAIVLMLLLFGFFAARESTRSPLASPLAGAYGRPAPPEPRLQADPRGDLRALRAAEDVLLHTYGWVDREQGVVKVPIERAMELLVARDGGAAPAAEEAR